jgi:small subunit ribosomal protein S13
LADENDKKPEIKPKAKAPEKDSEESDDFKYIVRIANTDINGDKALVHALTSIKGVGDRMARVIVNKTGLPPYDKIGDLADEDIQKLEEFVLGLEEKAPGWMLNKQHDVWTGGDIHLLGAEMEMRIQDDVNILKKIRCYRGIRHEKGQKVRGQRTKAHGRTGLTVGVVKKAQKSKQ